MFICFKVKRKTAIIALTAIVFSITGITALAVTLESVFAAKDTRQVPIITYHNIVKDESAWNEYNLSPVELEKDFIWLKEHGYEPVFIKDLVSYVNGNGKLPEKPIVLTFDDGGYNNILYVLPLLEKYNFKAVFSIIGAYSEYACEEAEPSESESYLDWEDINKMQKSNHAEFANHSYNLHSLDDRRGCNMKEGETYEQFRHVFLADIFTTQHLLEDHCNISPEIFTYPYGITCNAAERLVKNSGFSASLGTEEKVNTISIDKEECLYNLGRFNRSAYISTEDFMDKHNIN